MRQIFRLTLRGTDFGGSGTTTSATKNFRKNGKITERHCTFHVAMVRAVAHALPLIKRIDRHVLGPSAPYLWREVRKRRYQPILSPPRVAYMMVPHFHLTGEDRIRTV